MSSQQDWTPVAPAAPNRPPTCDTSEYKHSCSLSSEDQNSRFDSPSTVLSRQSDARNTSAENSEMSSNSGTVLVDRGTQTPVLIPSPAFRPSFSDLARDVAIRDNNAALRNWAMLLVLA